LSSDDRNGFLLKMVPPIRTVSNMQALWGGLLDGSIDLVGTDNTSRTRATKQPEAGLQGARPGYAGLGTHLPALLHFGHHVRGVPLELLAERMCRTPARVFGLYPKKGTIAVGSDADLVVVDPLLERDVSADALGGMSDFSPFEGKRLRGWPVATIKAGRVVARGGQLVDQRPAGRYLPRF
jgi:dihydropyrimidinase